MKLTPERIAEIEAAEAAATEGPWEAEIYQTEAGVKCEDDGGKVGGSICSTFDSADNQNTNSGDPVFIAMARTAIPELLADREALTAKIERWKIQYEREAVQGDKFADIIERIASEGKKDRARAEAAESESAALVEKVERLEGELETAMETLTVVYGKFPDVRYAITKAAEKAGKS